MKFSITNNLYTVYPYKSAMFRLTFNNPIVVMSLMKNSSVVMGRFRSFYSFYLFPTVGDRSMYMQYMYMYM